MWSKLPGLPCSRRRRLPSQVYRFVPFATRLWRMIKPERLTPAEPEPEDLADTLAFALRFEGRKRKHCQLTHFAFPVMCNTVSVMSSALMYGDWAVQLEDGAHTVHAEITGGLTYYLEITWDGVVVEASRVWMLSETPPSSGMLIFLLGRSAPLGLALLFCLWMASKCQRQVWGRWLNQLRR